MQIPDSTPRFRLDLVTCFINKQHGLLVGTLRNIIIGKQWLNYNASLQQGSYKVVDMREVYFHGSKKKEERDMNMFLET